MISYSLPPLYSGAGTQALRLAQALTERGLCVSALTARHTPDLAAHETVEGVAIHRLSVVRNQHLRPLSFFLAAAWYVLHHRKRYDIIHLHGAYRRAIPIVAAAQLANLNTVVKMSMMGTDDPSTTREWRFGGLLMKALARADAVVAITEELANSYLQADLPRNHLVRIPNGVDTARFYHPSPGRRQSLRKTLGLPLNAPIILFVGIVHPRKGVDQLLEAWPTVQAQYPEATLVLVGPVHSSSSGVTSSFFEKLYTYADQYHIHLAGQQKDVQHFFMAADIFVLPSRMEGLPNALLEAMACGLPVISSPLPGISEVIDHDTNGLLASSTTMTLSDAILHLLGDPERAQRLGEAAHQTVLKHYSLSVVADRYVHLYDLLVDTRE